MKNTRIPILFILIAILFVCSNINTYAKEGTVITQTNKADMMQGLLDVIKNYNTSNIIQIGDNTTQDKEQTENEAVSNGASVFDTQTKKAKIKVFFHKENISKEVEIEKYVLGVLAAEVSDRKNIEALKAQAVAIRTMAYYRINSGQEHSGGASVCTDSTCCQAWTETEYSQKYIDAVEQTKGIVIKYEGECISSYYFDCSGGYTESIENVWGGNKPYLVSVPSPGESEFSSYYKSYEFTEEKFAKALGIKGASFKNISDVVRSKTGRIISLKINGVEMSGTSFRSKLGLRSTNAYFSTDADGSILISTLGYGHGVGMSQCGAEVMAQEGADFIEILTHYYTGVTIGQL